MTPEQALSVPWLAELAADAMASDGLESGRG